MQRKQARRRESSPASQYADTRAAERVHPDMLKRVKKITRMDDILAPYRGRSYEGPVDPEVV